MCSVDGCERDVFSTGICQMHYLREFRAKHNPTKICKVDGCERKHHARGFCQIHYMQNHRRGVCTVHGCERDVDARGMCQKHYQRHMRGAKITKYEYDDEDAVVEVSEAEIRRQKIERAKWEYFIHQKVERMFEKEEK